jgi:hypothetical protein
VIIPLTQGYTTEIDDEDWELVRHYKWRALINPTQVYARSQHEQEAVLMHSLIFPPPEGMTVDHRDRNGLNNRRSNLRHCSHADNSHNTDQPVGRSGYRGVIKHGYTDKWRARVSVARVVFEEGPFDTPEEAARARDHLAIQHHGEFAVLNFPKEQRDDASACQEQRGDE